MPLAPILSEPRAPYFLGGPTCLLWEGNVEHLILVTTREDLFNVFFTKLAGLLEESALSASSPLSISKTRQCQHQSTQGEDFVLGDLTPL